MTIRIVTDSTCDLPQATIDRYGITVLPLHIHFGQQSMLDGIEITRAEFYERLPGCNPAPTTAAPGAEVFKRTYEKLERAGATEILSIHISATLSAVTDVAHTAAKEYHGAPVTVVDSQQLSMGVGFVVEAAAEAAAEGLPLREVLERIEERIQRTHVFAALDTLEYLRRSGRMNGVIAGIGSLLQIKPILHMTRGKASADAYGRADGRWPASSRSCSRSDRWNGQSYCMRTRRIAPNSFVLRRGRGSPMSFCHPSRSHPSSAHTSAQASSAWQS